MIYLILFAILAVPVGDCLIEHGWQPPEVTREQGGENGRTSED